jgi:23S rRNA (guanine2445-N2)-methyltransferase / 23S rRNA (guanine2069-N7)-methyltransferase
LKRIERMQRWFATCPKGMEYLLRDELTALGACDAHEALSGVHFDGDTGLAYRACLWSRLASRILLPLAEFEAPDDPSLYRGVAAVDWSRHLGEDGTLAVDANSHASALTHTRFLVQRVKDAIVDQFRDATGTRPGVDTAQPSIRINLSLRRDRAIVSLDLAGTPLHRRGWRREQGAAPLKENLACAMLIRAGWPAIAREGGALVDPMCGSGTLPIEAALMAADVAPGLRRPYYGLSGWRQHDPVQWHALLEEAHARAERGVAALRSPILGRDGDPRMIDIARANAESAGIGGSIDFRCGDARELVRPAGVDNGLVIANPPYGERLGERAALAPRYREFGERLRTRFTGWRAAVIVADEELGHALGLRARKSYVLYNGALECRLLLFDLDLPKARVEASARPLSAGAEAVANRIAKNVKHLRKRLAREGIGCWRAYDADLPEYAAAIDVYTAIGKEAESDDADGFPQAWLHVQEYAPPADIPAQTARARLADLVRAAGHALNVPRERIAIKTRQRGKGGAKYGRMDARGEFLVVGEGGLRFLVNLFDYLDTGLFLDHRPVRAMIAQRARGLRFLNLFCYTGAATVHAAAGGARHTTSVDLSATYLDWAARNLALNGFGANRAHELVQADSMAWLQHDRGEYDLIFVDPPTFSNSARAEDFDVQRDHERLLGLCAARLADDGVILFSNNFRRFALAAELRERFDVREFGTAGVPFDFARNPRIHRLFEIRRRVRRGGGQS